MNLNKNEKMAVFVGVAVVLAIFIFTAIRPNNPISIDQNNVDGQPTLINDEDSIGTNNQ